jgi:hypothetical protein
LEGEEDIERLVWSKNTMGRVVGHSALWGGGEGRGGSGKTVRTVGRVDWKAGREDMKVTGSPVVAGEVEERLQRSRETGMME